MKFENLIIFLRHFPTQDEKDDKVSSNVSALPILEESLPEIMELANQLNLFKRKVSLKNIYCSDSFQALQTATLLGAATGLKVVKTEQLRNINRPQWEGLTNSEIKMKFPNEFNIWCNRPGDVTFSDGESIDMVRKRILSFCSQNSEPKVIVAHTTVFHSLLLENFNLSDNKAWDFKPEMFCFTVIYNGTLWALNTRNLEYLTLDYK